MLSIRLSAPVDIRPPELKRVVSDSSALIRLFPLQHDTVSHYMVVVVPANFRKTPDDVRLDEVISLNKYAGLALSLSRFRRLSSW